MFCNKDSSLFSGPSGNCEMRTCRRWAELGDLWGACLRTHQSSQPVCLHLCTNAWPSLILLISYSDSKVLGLFPFSRGIYFGSILKNILEFSNIFFHFFGKGQRCVARLSFPFHSWLMILLSRRALCFWHCFLVMSVLRQRRWRMRQIPKLHPVLFPFSNLGCI